MAKPGGAGRSDEELPPPAFLRSRRLVAVPGADRNALAACGTAPAEHGGATFGLHASAETVSLHAAVAVGLKCALGHGNVLLFLLENLCLDGKYQVYRRTGFESSRR